MAGKSKIPQLQWSQVAPAPIILVSGPEDFLADRAFSSLRNQLREKDPDVEVTELDATNYVSGEILTLASPSLFGEPRLIRVGNVEKCNDDFLTEMIDYVQSADADTTVVLRHAGGVRGKKLLELLRSGQVSCTEVVCAEIKNDNDKYDFAAREFKNAGTSISASALRALVQAFSSSSSELANACQQLIADSDGEISDRTVEDYYGGRVEATAFKVADFAVAGRQGDALLSLRHALDTGADPVPIVATFAMKLRLMAKIFGDRRSSAELAGAVGAAPWQIDKAKRDLQGWNEYGLGSAIEFVAQTDANVKGAGRDPIYALESMVSVVSQYGRLNE